LFSAGFCVCGEINIVKYLVINKIAFYATGLLKN